MTTFVGQRQSAFVESLVDHLERLQAGEDVPRVILLEAESGAGKSRLIREFYEQLRLRQPVSEGGEGYWPPLQESAPVATSGLEPLTARKVLGPKTQGFVRPPGAVPAYSWLAVNCADGADGSFVDVTQLLWPNLRAHVRFLVEGWKKATTTKEQFAQWVTTQRRAGATQLGDEASVMALESVLDAVLGVAVPGIGPALSGVKAGVRSYGNRRKTRLDLASGGLLDGESSGTTRDLAAALLRLVATEMPMIVAIEDLHLMDPTLSELLGELARPAQSKPILIVGSAWPEGRDYVTYRTWRDDLLLRERASLYSGSSFPYLGAPELVDLSRQFAPASDEAMLGMLASKWPNPYALSLALSDAYFISDFVHDGRLQISAEDLKSMPSTIRDLFRRRWRALPAEVQDVLMLVAGALPSDDITDVAPFLREAVLEASDEVPVSVTSAADRRAALRAAVDPSNWIRTLSQEGEIQQFRELSLQAVAYDQFIENRGRHAPKLRAAISRVLRRLVPRQFGESPSASELVACRWLLEIDPSEDEITALAALTLADAAGATSQSAKALELMTPQVVSTLCDRPVRTSYVQQQLALWNLRDRRFAEALAALEKAIQCAEELGHSDERAILDRLRAIPLVELGYPQEAIAIHEAALLELEQQTHPADRQLAFHRRHLGTALAQVGRSEESVQILLDAATQIPRPKPGSHYAMEEVETLNAYGLLLLATEKADDALGIFQDLQDALPVEPDSQVGLTIRANYASALARLGDPLGVEMLREIVHSRSALVGIDHPQTLLARAKLAQIELQQGAPTALADLRQVFDRQVEAGVKGNDLSLTGIELIKQESLTDEQAHAVAEAMVKARHPDLDNEEARVRAINSALLVRAHSGPRAAEMELQTSAMQAAQSGDFAEAVRRYQELADRLVSLGEDEVAVAVCRLNAIVNEVPILRKDVSTPSELEDKALDRIRRLDRIIPVIIRGVGESGTLALTAARTRVLLQIEARHLRGALVALRQIAPLMVQAGHLEAKAAEGQLALLEAVVEFADRRLLRSIQSLADSNPTAAVEAVSEAIDVLRTAGVLTRDDQRSASSEAKRLSLFVSDARYFRKGIVGVAKALQEIVDEDFRR